jgi:predicted TIM-barrel fold metal-dependent hydrolase
MHLVDTHQHLWNLEQFPYSWCASIPALNRSFLIEDYLAASVGCGITKTVFMECDVDEPHALDEARKIQKVADRHPLIAGLVASGRPENEAFPAHLEQLAKLSKLRGFRRVLHTRPDAVSQQTRFIENVRLLPEFSLPFDLCVNARQLPLATALVDACPHVAFILDHCGVPDVKSGSLDPWRDNLRSIAQRPNVVCKISGLVAYAEPATWSVADLRPWIEHTLDCFGWDRVLWGGDWPVCTLSASLIRWVGASHQLVSSATPEQQAKFFHLNAERIYRV